MLTEELTEEAIHPSSPGLGVVRDVACAVGSEFLLETAHDQTFFGQEEKVTVLSRLYSLGVNRPPLHSVNLAGGERLVALRDGSLRLIHLVMCRIRRSLLKNRKVLIGPSQPCQQRVH